MRKKACTRTHTWQRGVDTSGHDIDARDVRKGQTLDAGHHSVGGGDDCDHPNTKEQGAYEMADGSDTVSGPITQKYLTSWLRKLAISPTQNIVHTCSHCGASSPLLHRLVYQTLEHDLVLGAGTLRDAIACGNQCIRQAHKCTCRGGTYVEATVRCTVQIGGLEEKRPIRTQTCAHRLSE